MSRKMDNKGLSLVELIVAIAIMAILVGAIAPQMFKYVERAKQVKVEKETSEFMRAAQIALVDVTVQGDAPKGDDAVNNLTVSYSPYYKGGTGYGNLTNWTVKNGVSINQKTGKPYSNATFADEFFGLLGIVYGKGVWNTGKSSIPISEKEPKQNPSGSLSKECVFQVFYDIAGNVVVEYSREGYFVRMENSLLVESVKIKNEAEEHFTSWGGKKK